MKKQLIKLFFIGSLAISILYGIYAYGCSDGWWGSRYSSIFSPEITVNNKDYEPFFYDDYTIFYNGYSIKSTTDLFKEETIDDWTNYLEKYDKKTIAYYLYDDKLTDILTTVASTDHPEEELNSYIVKRLVLDTNDQKTKNFLSFIFMSRGIEAYSNQNRNYWDYNNRVVNLADQDFVSKKEELYYNSLKEDSFYKNRLWFQVMRAKFYSNDRSSVITFFEQTAKDQPKNSLYYRGLSYLAGAYKSLKNYEKSNALFAQIFDEFKPLMPSSLFDYKPLDAQAFKNSLQKASSQNTREALYALQGYYTNGFEYMENLYRLNPQSKHLDFLLSRWVNINEQSIHIYDEFASLDVIDTDKVKLEIKSKINPKELQWINQVVDENKVTNPYIWKSAAAYFNTFIGDYQRANGQLQEAFHLAKNQQQKKQVRSLRLFNNLLSTHEISLESSSKLIEDINWLFYDESNAGDLKLTNRTAYLQTFVKKYLSALYEKQGDAMMAEITNPRKGFYYNQTNSEVMETFLLSNNRSAWEDIFVGIYPYNLADIYESRGIYLFYQNKIEEAIAEFEKIQPFERRKYNWHTRKYEIITVDYKNLELPANPFNGKIKDCNDCDHRAKQPVKYSRLSFLKKVKEMQDKIKEGKDVFNNAWLVGNAFYNASYFGNSRVFYYNRIIDEYGINISDKHQLMLYSMDNVKKYYTLAQNNAHTDEDKAKMAYMFAKVERNDFYAQSYFIPNDYYSSYGEFISFKKWGGFIKLNEEYSHTNYYREVINECGYFRKYLGAE